MSKSRDGSHDPISPAALSQASKPATRSHSQEAILKPTSPISNPPKEKVGRSFFVNPTSDQHPVNYSPNKKFALPFPDNTIRTARYTILSFLPQQLFAQLSKVANMYFLLVSILQAIPDLSPTGRFTTVFPLIIFLLVSICKEAYDDYFRHKHDASENNAPVTKITKASASRPRSFSISRSDTIPLRRLGSLQLTQFSCKELRVGDLVALKQGDFIPADIIVLSSSNENGICYVETSNLDGETNLKMRQALKATSDCVPELQSLSLIHVESPNGDLYNFEGSMAIDNVRYPLTSQQLLQRGATLKNTKEVYGIVVYTGEESKIRMNANNETKTKRPHLELYTNKVILCILAFLLILAAISTFAYISWDKFERQFDRGSLSGLQAHWYLVIPKSDYAWIYFTFFILYNAFIPISLYVTMEVVKVIQVYFIKNDLDMYDSERDIPAEANTSSLNEELGQVQYIFSDKTGTLTENIMEFRMFSVGGKSVCYRSAPGIFDTVPVRSVLSGIGNTLSRREKLSPEEQLTFDFLEAMALCHTVVPEEPSETNANQSSSKGMESIQYQSSSADEVAILKAARDMSFCLKRRDQKIISVNIFNSPSDVTYELLHVIEFSSDRKRMSTVYRYPNGRIVLLCKGADSVILERLQPADELSPVQKSIQQKTISDTSAYATTGLRTLLYAYRVLEPEEYREWSERFNEASISIQNRAANMFSIAEDVEKNLILLGATAIEDKLQSGVPETIDKLRRANIKVWMLTGDKTETAINIGRTCNLIKSHSILMVMDEETCPVKKDNNMESITMWLESSIVRFREIKAQKSALEHIVVAVEGRVLSRLEKFLASIDQIDGRTVAPLELHAFERLLDLLIAVDNVICCRFSPSQKALLVKKVKDRLSNQHKLDSGASALAQEYTATPSFWKKLFSRLSFKPRDSGVTLAIGDGANDIPMMLSAHVGIGITGREGLAASRASDYSISKFRFLQVLLFVHGRWSYIRVSKFILGTLYKNFCFYGTQLFFQFWTGYTGTSLYEQWTLAVNNVFFTSIPVLIIGVFEKDLNKSTLLAVPELYRYGQENRAFNFRKLMRWLFQGLFHAAISVLIPALYYNGYFNPQGTFGNSVFTNKFWSTEMFNSDGSGNYQETGLFPFGTIVYTSTIIFCTVKVLYIESHMITWVHHFVALLTFTLWVAYNYVYSLIWRPRSLLVDTAIEYSGLTYSIDNTQGTFWGLVIMTVVIGLLLEDATVKVLSGFNRLWKWGAIGGRNEVIVSGNYAASERSFEEACLAVKHADGEHDWGGEVLWWQIWEKKHGVFSDV